MLARETAACSRLLGEVGGGPVDIVGIHGLGSPWAPVERVVLARDYPRIGRTVVVKTRRHDEPGWGGDRSNLVAEHAALEMLTATCLDVAPEVLGFDEADGVLVMRDLGAGPTVERILFDGTYDDARASLVGLATSLGRVHAATTAIEPAPWNESALFIQGIDGPWQRLASEAERLGFPDPRPAATDVTKLAAALADPRWRTLTHGDLTPGNALLREGAVYLVDFEGANPRHAAIDGAAFRISFPQYGRWATLPEEVVTAADWAYRSELARGVPLAEDAIAYGQAMAAGCAAWAILRLSRLGVIAAEDQEPEVRLRRRSQIVHTVESARATAAKTASFPRLMGWVGAVTAEMRRRWPEANAEPRQFPAFANESSTDD